MNNLKPEAAKAVSDIAARHDVSTEAVEALLSALARGHGSQAQFNHPDLGGMGQWSGGGMVMVGDMFNQSLKAKVDAICTELSKLLSEGTVFAEEPTPPDTEDRAISGSPPDSAVWPTDLGTASSTGSQNAMRYAVFPESRRLAIQKDGRIEVYDTGEHHISGVSQQQSSGQSLSFVSQHGPVRITDLRKVS